MANKLNAARRVAIDLFSGAGGLTEGLKLAGFKVLAGVEFNPIAATTYCLNHPRTKLYRNDIRTLDPVTVMRDLSLQPGDLDLLAGCPPCQGFSSHRTRNRAAAVDDDRNDLVFEFIRYVEAFLPKTVMLENVPALAKDKRISIVKERLAKLGYQMFDDSVQVKDAAQFGCPQRRRRLILKASRFGYIANPEPVLKMNTVRKTIGKLPPPYLSTDALHNLVEQRSEKVQRLIKMIPKDGGSRTDLPIEHWLECHKKYPGGYKDVYGRMAWDVVSPTITGGCHNPSKGRFIHPDQDRAITLREAALLQTFPMQYKFSLERGKDSVALMIGNALPPKFIKKHAEKFLEHLAGVSNVTQTKI